MAAVGAEKLGVIARYFLEKVPNIVRKTKNVVIDGCGGKDVQLNPDVSSASLYRTLCNRLSPEQVGELVEKVGTVDCTYIERDPTTYDRAIYEIISTLAPSHKEDPHAAKGYRPDPGEVYFNDAFKTPLSRLKLIINVHDVEKSFLFDEKEELMHRYDHKFITQRLKELLGEGYGDWMRTNSEDCKVEYSPWRKEKIYLDEKAQQKVFNQAFEAPWRNGWSPDPLAICPPEIEKFMRLFIPNERDRKTAYAWLRDATFDRAEPIMVFCGTPGVGKNIYVEHLACALVGKDNYRTAARGFNKSYFHNNVSNCRLFFLDEMSLTLDARETLKSYHNGVATIERKGKDVVDPEKISASFIVANNHENKIQLEYTDRKFFVPVLSATPLLVNMPQEELEEGMIRRLKEDVEYVRRFASYLYHNFKPRSSSKFEKNDFFRKLCINSYPHYFRRFIHAAKQQAELSARTFNRGQKRQMDMYELKDYIEHYEKSFNEPLVDFVIATDGNWTAYSRQVGGSVSEKKSAAPAPTTPTTGEPKKESGQLLL
jgi:hypothetical protein